ncbi:hypothetical protein BGX26_001848, partial [Mortierella sp. AD094]
IQTNGSKIPMADQRIRSFKETMPALFTDSNSRLAFQVTATPENDDRAYLSQPSRPLVKIRDRLSYRPPPHPVPLA